MSFKVIGVGEVLWDLLPAGKQLGGAPANFASHAHALGAEAIIVSKVGKDPLGIELVQALSDMGLPTHGILVDSAAPTGTVSVTLDGDGVPSFTIHENVAWDLLEAGPAALEAARGADAICFGTLAQRHPAARTAIRAIVEAAPPSALRILDINLRQHFYSARLLDESLRLANVLKLNEVELAVLAELFGVTGNEFSLAEKLAARYELKAVALTKGAQGSTLWLDRKVATHPAAEVAVVDTVGAGDAYTAALALGLLGGREPEAILTTAHELAEYVCTQAGATPALGPRFRDMFCRR